MIHARVVEVRDACHPSENPDHRKYEIVVIVADHDGYELSDFKGEIVRIESEPHYTPRETGI